MTGLEELQSSSARPSRLQRSLPALRAGATAAVAALVVAFLAPRGGGALAVLAVPAALLAGFGRIRVHTWPGAVAVGGLGAAYCGAVVSTPVDVGATAAVSVLLFVAFQVVTSPGGLLLGIARPSSLVAVVTLVLAAASGPLVLVLTRGVGGVADHLYLPALAAGVVAVAAPTLVAARRARDRG